MSRILPYKLLADLALSSKTSKIISELITNYYQSQMVFKDIPMTIMASPAFLAQQGLYVSSLIHQIIHSNFNSTVNISLKSFNFGFADNENERTFIHFRSQSNSNKISLDNRQEWSNLLIAQLTDSNSETDLADWNIWTDNQGYLYFQPTNKALSNWLKILFMRTAIQQSPNFLTIPDGSTVVDNLFYYIKLRCNQMQKLAGSLNKAPVTPWIQGEFHCHQTAELELIHSIIQVYDSLYMGAKHQIVAAGKSLVENFLEFDRTCRLLDLPVNSPEFHERAGLIAIVRSAVEDLLAQATFEDLNQSHNFDKI
jgi:hypothetical protein